MLAKTGRCRCGSALPVISVQGRCDDVLRFPDTNGRVVALPPLVIGSVADETPGGRRSQLMQDSPTTLRIRLDIDRGGNPDRVWKGVRSKVATYLTAHNLRDIEIIRDQERPQHATGGGKYRQVIANVPH